MDSPDEADTVGEPEGYYGIWWENQKQKESQKLEDKCRRRRTCTPVFLGVIKTVHKSPLNLVTCRSPLILATAVLVERRGWFKRTREGNE